MNGRSTSGTTGLGTVEVSGRRRVPSPPARISACISRPVARRPSDGLVDQARGARGLRVDEVAPVDEQRAAHRPLDAGEIELEELRPLRHQHDRIRPLDRLGRGRGERDAADQLARLLLGDRVVGAHARAGALQPRRQHERRRLAHVVGVRLEREPEQRDLLADERAEVLLQLRDHAPLLQLVDLDHGVEQLEVVARVAGELLQRGDILREAGTAEADPRLQELGADAVVQAHAAGHLDDVRAGLLADVRDLVDERDLRREERVRGELDHLRRLHVGAHDRRRQRRVERLDGVAGPVVVVADHDAVGRHEVLDRRALLEELRAGDVAEALALLGERALDALARADRHRRLHHERVAVGGGHRADDRETPPRGRRRRSRSAACRRRRTAAARARAPGPARSRSAAARGARRSAPAGPAPRSGCAPPPARGSSRRRCRRSRRRSRAPRTRPRSRALRSRCRSRRSALCREQRSSRGRVY